MDEKIRETLQKQLLLLSERSAMCGDDKELASLTGAIVSIVRLLIMGEW